MQFCKPLLPCAFVLALLAFPPLAGAAGIYPDVVVYGDSLSDNGNLYALSGDTIPASPPYYAGRFSNGPVAVEQLASNLGANLVDFAVAGATSGLGNYDDNGSQTSYGLLHLPGLQVELASPASVLLLSNPQLVANSLFVVWGGANDFLTGGSAPLAAQNIDNIVTALQTDGAQHILVPGAPDLGDTPDFFGTPDQSAATGYALAFNAALQTGLPQGATYFDTFDLLHEIINDPGAYGLTDVTDPCLVVGTVTTTVCSNPNQYLFWDGFHPTTAADAIVAQQFQSAVTPEPGTVWLMGTGLSGLAVLVRRRLHPRL